MRALLKKCSNVQTEQVFALPIAESRFDVPPLPTSAVIAVGFLGARRIGDRPVRSHTAAVLLRERA